MDQKLLLALYSIALALVCLFGSKLSEAFRKDHSKLQSALSFVSGILLGLALLHFLPTAAEELGSTLKASYWMLGGLLTVFFLERFFCYHHHEESDCSSHGHDLSWSSTLIGLSVHSILEGFALAAAVSSLHVSSLAVFLGIIFHKPFDGFTLSVLLEKNKAKNTKLVSWLFALTAPLGALIYILAFGLGHGHAHFSVGAALAFSGGTFLCTSLSDLLPELHFHNHDRLKLSLALLLGILVTVASSLLEVGHVH